MEEFLKLNMFVCNNNVWTNKDITVVPQDSNWRVIRKDKVIFVGKEDKAINFLLNEGICIFI